MLPNLSCYQLKICCYKYKIFYVSLIVMTKEKSIVDIQNMIKQSNTTTKMYCHKRREQDKRQGTKDLQNN